MRSTTHQGVKNWLVITGLFACLLVIVCTGFGLMSATQKNLSVSAFHSVLHWHPVRRWHDARHDWLVVVDSQTHEVLVYNAADGRPLGRIGELQKSVADLGR